MQVNTFWGTIYFAVDGTKIQDVLSVLLNCYAFKLIDFYTFIVNQNSPERYLYSYQVTA